MAVINKIQDVFGTTFGLCGVVEMPNCGIWKKVIYVTKFGFTVNFSTKGWFHTLSWMGSAVVVATCWDWGSGETWTWLTSFLKIYIIIMSLKINFNYLLLYWLDRFINKLYILITAHHYSATGILPQTKRFPVVDCTRNSCPPLCKTWVPAWTPLYRISKYKWGKWMVL